MGTGDRHIIRKASLEVNAGAVDAFRFQNEAVAWARDTLLPELDSLFAGLPATEAHVILDRLELQVDATDPSRWTEEVLPRLKSELAAVLHRKLREAGDGEGEERATPARSFARKLAYYLEHGVLPWNLIATSALDLIQQVETWLASEDAQAASEALADTLKSPSARLRLREALPPPLLQRLLIRVFGLPKDLAAAWCKDAHWILPSPDRARSSAAPPILPPRLLEEILQAVSHNPRVFEQGLEEEIVQGYLGRLLSDSPRHALEWQFLRFESPAFIHSVQRLLRQPAGSQPTPSEAAPNERAQPDNESKAPTEPSSDTATTPRAKRSSSEVPALEGTHVANAGVILVAPFLSMLFERLDLTDKAQLKDPSTALSLVHFLATGEEGPVEFQLPLAKVLCGLPLEKAISLPMTLADKPREESLQLLESVIGHWGVLKNTSVDGLREGFLQRSGRLSRRPQGDWLLQVEQKAYDMLLQQLPWSFQIIRLPWMKQLLRTEWVE